MLNRVFVLIFISCSLAFPCQVFVSPSGSGSSCTSSAPCTFTNALQSLLFCPTVNIWMFGGTYGASCSNFFNGTQLAIRGGYQTGATIIDCQYNSPFLTTSASVLYLSGLTLRHGFSNSSASGSLVTVTSASANVTIDSCFLESSLSAGGGALSVLSSSANITISSTTFSNHAAWYNATANGGVIVNVGGAAIFTRPLSSGGLFIDSSKFLNNSFGSPSFSLLFGGGAVHASLSGTAVAQITNSVFEGNQVFGGNGGALFFTAQPSALSFAPHVIIQGCSFVSNSAEVAELAQALTTPPGGGSGYFSLIGATFQLTNCTFDQNSVSQLSGGALIITQINSFVTIQGSTFSENVIECSGDTCSNAQPPSGGALSVFSSGDSSLFISGSDFIGNSAALAGGGGAMMLIGSFDTLLIQNDVFNFNYLVTSGSQSASGGAALAFCTVGTTQAQAGNFQMTNLTFYGNSLECSGSTGTSGGAIYLSGINSPSPWIYINQTTFSNNDIGLTCLGGGALGLETLDVAVLVTDGVFQNNTAFSIVQGGGAISVMVGTLSMTGTTIFNNTAVYGGGLYASISTVFITNSTIQQNSASRDGGGAYGTSDSDIQMVSTNVDGNTATERGAGLLMRLSSVLNIVDSVLSGGKALFGAGIYANSFASVGMSNSIITRPVALQGAGVYLLGAFASLENTVFDQCLAEQEGAAMFTSETAEATCTGCLFTGGQSAGTAGCLLVTDVSSFAIENSIFYNCTAVPQTGSGVLGGGGAVEVSSMGQLFIHNVTIFYGQAMSGGAILVTDSATLDASELFIDSCQSFTNGGGLQMRSTGTCMLSNSVISGCSAQEDGGAIAIASGVTALTNVQLLNNYAVDGGGLWLSSSTSLFCANVEFDSNNAQRGGGMFVNDGPGSSGPVVPILWTSTDLTFINNVAQCQSSGGCSDFATSSGGGGIFFNFYSPYENLTFEFSFANNSAPFGSNFGSVPVDLLIVPLQESVIPGQRFELSAVFIDLFAQNVTSLNNFDAFVFCSSDECPANTLSGPATTVASVSGVVTFSDLSLHAPPLSVYQVTIKPASPEILPPTLASHFGDSTALSVALCPAGWGYQEDQLFCAECAIGFYSIVPSSNPCKPCPNNVKCAAGQPPVPATGYWLLVDYNAQSVKAFLCPGAFCENDVDPSSQCAPHRDPMVPMCGACEAGFSYWDGNCVPCTQINYLVTFGVLVLLFFYVLVQHIVAQRSSATLRSFFFFTQTAALCLYPSRTAILNWVDSGPTTIFGCPFPRPSGYAVLLFNVLLPVVFISMIIPAMSFCALVARVLRILSDHKKRSQAEQAKGFSFSNVLGMLAPKDSTAAQLRRLFDRWGTMESSKKTFFAFLVTTYQTFARNTVSFLQCQNVGDQVVNTTFPDIQCNSQEYRRWLWLYIPWMVYVVSFPMVLAFAIWRQERFFKPREVALLEEHSDLVWGPEHETLTEGYRRNFRFWEPFAVLRRLILTVALPFIIPNNFFLLRLLYMIALLCFLSLHLVSLPYRTARQNLLETISLFVLVVTAGVLAAHWNYVTTSEDSATRAPDGITFLLIVSVSFILLLSLYPTARRFLQFYRTFKRRQRQARVSQALRRQFSRKFTGSTATMLADPVLSENYFEMDHMPAISPALPTTGRASPEAPANTIQENYFGK